MGAKDLIVKPIDRKAADALVESVHYSGKTVNYIYPLAPTVRERLTVPILPYSAIDDAGARMYRGSRVGGASRSTPADHVGDGGATPTPTLEP